MLLSQLSFFTAQLPPGSDPGDFPHKVLLAQHKLLGLIADLLVGGLEHGFYCPFLVGMMIQSDFYIFQEG